MTDKQKRVGMSQMWTDRMLSSRLLFIVSSYLDNLRVELGCSFTFKQCLLYSHLPIVGTAFT